jgi:hypothetical protein
MLSAREAAIEIGTVRRVIRAVEREATVLEFPRFWGGPGDGEICAACDPLITKE